MTRDGENSTVIFYFEFDETQIIMVFYLNHEIKLNFDFWFDPLKIMLILLENITKNSSLKNYY